MGDANAVATLETKPAKGIIRPASSEPSDRFEIQRKESPMNGLRRLALLGALVLSAATGCKPDPAEQHRDKANELANQSQWKQAAEEYGLSLQADPKQGELWEQKAYAHLQIKEYDQVESAMLKLADSRTDPPKKAA